MKVAVGMFYHEANSFNPFLLQKEDLVYCEGQEVLDRLYATSVFEEAGAELVPLIYAVALPNGLMAKDDYDFFSGRILDILAENRDVDAVFLHLHGSTEVDQLGSGEYDLLKRIRALLGDQVYIGVAMDFHANNDPRLGELINVERNYRTVPHTDQDVTERTVAQKLLDCIRNGEHTVPQLVRLPYCIHAEKALLATYPLNEMFARLNELEKREEIAIASLACGFQWCDCETTGTSVVITPSRVEYTDYCRKVAQEYADYVYSMRDQFEFGQLPLSPHEAVRYAMQFKYESPVYISDSGDNTTGGAVGDHTVLLREFLRLRESDCHGKRALVTSIWDEKAVEEAWKHEEGETISLSVGKDHDENTRAVQVTGVLRKKGNLLGYMGCEKDIVGKCVTISVGNIDFCVIDRPGSFISRGHFEELGAGLRLDDYQVVVVKQGYLFAELRALAKLAIIALTPGATHQIIENMEFHKIHPPIYPLRYVGDK